MIFVHFRTGDMKNKSVPSKFPDSLTLTELIQYKEDTKVTTFQSLYCKEWNDIGLFILLPEYYQELMLIQLVFISKKQKCSKFRKEA